MEKNNFSLIFQDGPIGRAYLNFFKLKKYKPNKIYYLYKKNFLPKKINLKMNFNEKNYYPTQFIKKKNIYELCLEIETFFKFEKNFIQNMYNFDLLDFFQDQIVYLPNDDVNSDLLFQQIIKSEENNFLNTSNQIFKNILKTNKNFYHIHPGYLPLLRGADGTLNSLLHSNCYGVSFFKMTEKIDDGDIFLRKKIEYQKFNLEGYKYYDTKDVYRIWFSFFDPILRCSLLNEIINDSFNFEKINVINEKSSYHSFLKNNDLKIVFDKVFL